MVGYIWQATYMNLTAFPNYYSQYVCQYGRVPQKKHAIPLCSFGMFASIKIL